MFQRLQYLLLILVSGKDIESQRNTVPIHEEAHPHDWIRTVLLAFSVFSEVIFLFDLEIVIGAVIIKDLCIPAVKEIGITIDLGLDMIGFLCQDG